MNEELNLSNYQNKKLIAFDLYGTCIDHTFKDIILSKELLQIMKTNPISLQDIQDKKIEKDWIQIHLDNEFIENIKKDIESTFLFPETL